MRYTGAMQLAAVSIRPFLGAKDYALCRRFYRALGFEEQELSPSLCLFQTARVAFYLQDAYVKDWVDNTMVFVEVEDVERQWRELLALDLPAAYPGVRLVPIREHAWGRECFLHDPSGILWHFGQFSGR